VTTMGNVMADLVVKGRLDTLVIGDAPPADFGVFCPDRNEYVDMEASIESLRFPPVQALVFRRRACTIRVQVPAECNGGGVFETSLPVHATVYDAQEAVMASPACAAYTQSRGGIANTRSDHALYLPSKGTSLGLRLEVQRTLVSYRLKADDVLSWSLVPRDEILSSRASLEKYNDTMFVRVEWPSHGISKTVKVRAAEMTVQELMEEFLERSGTTVRDPLAYGLIMTGGKANRPVNAASASAVFLQPKMALSQVGCTNLCTLQFRQRRKPKRKVKLSVGTFKGKGRPNASSGGVGVGAMNKRRSVFKAGIDSQDTVTLTLPNAVGLAQESGVDCDVEEVTVPGILQQLRLLLRRGDAAGFRCEGVFRVAAR
jgi:hypothetical protein